MTSRRLWNCLLNAGKRLKIGPRFWYGGVVVVVLALTSCMSEPPLQTETLAAIDDPSLRVPDLAPWKERSLPLTSPSPFPRYDRKMSEAIDKRWHTLLEDLPAVLPRDRLVIIRFKQNRLGRVYDLVVEKDELGEPFTTLCKRAITERFPFDPRTWKMAAHIESTGYNYRRMRYSFYFNYMRPAR